MSNPKEIKAHYIGHRQRLRERFLSDSIFQDYELLEMLLFQSIPRKDTKPLAKKLLAEFGNLLNILTASETDLKKFKLNLGTITTIKLVYSISLRITQHSMYEAPTLLNFEKVIEYCRVKLQHLKVEEFLVIYLNKKNKVLKDETHQRGSIDNVPVYPREILKRCLELDASNIILVHNHPTGDVEPSSSDIQLTNIIVQAAFKLNIGVLDHIIVGNSKEKITSLKALGYI